jgi:hypothetical protein
MSEFKDIQRVLERARTMCEALECTGMRHWFKSAGDEAQVHAVDPPAADPEINQRFEALVAVEAMLAKLRRELVTANQLLHEYSEISSKPCMSTRSFSRR